MQTTVTVKQISHFSEFGWIEFEDFLSTAESAAIRAAIHAALEQRLHTQKLSRFGSDRLYLNGRDCWRDLPFLKQQYLSHRFSSTAASLTNKEPVFLACDQWIPSGMTLSPLHLHDHFSFQNLICGCLLFLDSDQHGRARFFHPDRLPLLNTGDQLLIAYGTMNSVYIHNPADPCNSLLKQYGYSFGDRIDAQLNPMCRTDRTS